MSSERSSRVPEFGRPETEEFAIGKRTHRVAKVEPLDVSGVRTMKVGTALWGIAILVMVPFWSTLQESGRTWWMWTAWAGLGIGLLGLEYCRIRAEAIAAVEKAQTKKAAAPKPVVKRSSRSDLKPAPTDPAPTDPAAATQKPATTTNTPAGDTPSAQTSEKSSNPTEPVASTQSGAPSDFSSAPSTAETAPQPSMGRRVRAIDETGPIPIIDGEEPTSPISGRPIGSRRKSGPPQ